ncbi:MAG: hypothetical protein ABS35_18000 [Kaistia sp. SCN 65-12]|nr:MAG: hypothetical protein ABS35_18000 [Kaistia sp. SCN 65-12]
MSPFKRQIVQAELTGCLQVPSMELEIGRQRGLWIWGFLEQEPVAGFCAAMERRLGVVGDTSIKSASG